MAHASSPTSTILPTEVSGFLIEDETVSSYTAVKQAASPNPLTSPSFCPLSNTQPSHLVRGCGGRDRTVGVEARDQRVVARRVVEADMRGLVTAGRCVRLERCAGLSTSVTGFPFAERRLAAHSLRGAGLLAAPGSTPPSVGAVGRRTGQRASRIRDRPVQDRTDPPPRPLAHRRTRRSRHPGLDRLVQPTPAARDQWRPLTTRARTRPLPSNTDLTEAG